MDLKKLKARKLEIAAEMKAIVEGAENGILSEDQTSQFDALKSEGETINGQVKVAEDLEKADAEAKALADRPAPILDRVVPQPQPSPNVSPSRIVIPASVRRVSNIKSFKGPDKDLKAYKFGQQVRAANGIPSAIEWCTEHGCMVFKSAHTEGVNTAGGYLVFPEFSNDIIDLRVLYGAYRRNARVRTMTSDTLSIPRRTGGLTAYWVGESTAGTDSTKSWDQVGLTAKKLMVLTKMSNELNEDSIISMADDLANEIAYAMAIAEDTAGFVGTGISTHGGVTGVVTRLADLNGVDDGGGLVLSAEEAWVGIILSEFHKVVSILPSYARLGAKWHCTPIFDDQVLQKLKTAAGGNSVPNIEAGGGNTFLGYPVEHNESMVSATAVSSIPVIFGNLQQSSSLGDRSPIELAFSTEATVGDVSVFETDEIAVRGRERLDINNHDCGTATAAGPIVGLITAAS